MTSLTETKILISSHEIAQSDRLKSLYPTVILASAVSGSATMIMLLGRSATTASVLNDVSTCLFVSSVITAVFTAMITIMLSFEFQSSHEPTRMRRATAWVPIFFFDFMLFELVLGLVFWFTAGHAWQYAALLGLVSGSLFMVTAAVAVWMTVKASPLSCLGKGL
ncbi:hypothetical protein Ct61P_06398 [Colletotrichum tofieldiae]|nr:hypothetical protein Ct61P_06398 [Colletotrichum tofieldiae]